MYFLERKEVYTMPNILGGHSFPVHTHRWKGIAICEDKEPLERELTNLDKEKYRVTSNIIN